jgi:hypothetical protein
VRVVQLTGLGLLPRTSQGGVATTEVG